jgi:ATP:ADP antiporter, AAA family
MSLPSPAAHDALPHELRPGRRWIVIVLVAAISAFCLLASFSMLRSVRDEMGVRGGVKNLPWLFTGTFVAMLVATPFFGWASSRLSRRALLIATYSFFASNLILFWVLLRWEVAPATVAKSFFVWASVFNLFVVSVFWSLLADVFTSIEAKARYGYIAAGASLGAIAGPAFTALASTWIGAPNLLLVAACALCTTLVGVVWISRGATPGSPETQPIGGGVLDGVRLVFSSKLLLSLCGYFLFFTTVATFLYLEQSRIAQASFDTSEARISFFATIDLVTNIVTVGFQFFVTRMVLTKFGSFRSLLVLPCVSLVGFALLVPGGSPLMMGGVQVARRASDYAFARPARESLFTLVDRDSRYKAKNFIDTVVYRGGDMVAAWCDAKMVGAGRLTVAAIGIPVVLLWLVWVLGMGRFAKSIERPAEGPAADGRGPV